MRYGIKLTIQLTHRHRLRVDNCVLDTVLVHQILKQNEYSLKSITTVYQSDLFAGLSRKSNYSKH